MNENRRIALITIGILLMLAVAGYLFVWPQMKPDEPVLPAEEVAAPPLATTPAQAPPLVEPPPDHYPLPTPAPDAPPLPALGESDAPFAIALAELADGVIAATVSEQRIRRLVATIDNLPRERLAVNDRAFRRVPDSFMVKSRDGTYTTNPANEARYLPLVNLANSVGAEQAARLYLRFYPLFDKAYRELGVGDRHFNDRLVQVIDHLLATPEVAGPIELVQPKVFYQFADPALESRSAGQKMLIRMGTVNQAQSKAWLKRFRAQVTGATTP